MQVFVLADIRDREYVLERVQKHYANQYYDTGRQLIFVASDGETTYQVAEKVGLSKKSTPRFTTGIVVSIDSYWGHNDPGLWEWLRVKENSNGN